MKSLLKLFLLVSGVLVLLEVQILPLYLSVYRLQQGQSQATTSAAAYRRLDLQTELATNSPQAMNSGLYSVNLVIYNRVPKTGSTSFMWVINNLCKQLHYNAVQIGISGKSYTMSPMDQYHLIQNITTWKDKLPGLYHGHFAFIDFQRYE
jgi:heparan sulfate 2-O-sulfotransferase HS2ST1